MYARKVSGTAGRSRNLKRVESSAWRMPSRAPPGAWRNRRRKKSNNWSVTSSAVESRKASWTSVTSL